MRKKSRLFIVIFAICVCAFAIALSGCSENSVADQNRDTFESFLGEQEQNSGIISYGILETANGNNDRMITISSKSDDPTLVEMKLYAVQDSEVTELDSEEVDFNDSDCYGGEYDFFLKNNNGSNYLFIKRLNVVDSGFLYCEGFLYNVDDEIVEQLDADAAASLEGFDFRVNGGEATEVLSYASGEMPEGELKEAFADWVDESNEYLEEAGLRFNDNYYDVYSFKPLVETIPNYDEKDSSEKHLCFIRKGGQKGGEIADFDNGQKEDLEITDYTGVADLLADGDNAEESVADNDTLYEPILGEYRNLITGGRLDPDIMTEEESGFAEGARGAYLDEDGYLDGAVEWDGECFVDLYYTYYDINKDGTDELLVAEFWDRDDDEASMNEFFYPGYYSIWTVKGNKPVNLFWGAERFNRYSILEDGTIACSSSGGAYTGSYEFYKINDDLTKEKLASASYDLDWDNVPDDEEYLEDYILYYPNDDYSGAPSKAKYDDILDKYLKNPVRSLQDKSNWESMF